MKKIDKAIEIQQKRRQMKLDKFAANHAKVISKIREENYNKYIKKCEVIEKEKYDKKEKERKKKITELNNAKKIIKLLENEINKKDKIIFNLHEKNKIRIAKDEYFKSQIQNNGKPTSVQVYERTSRLLSFIKYELDLRAIDDVVRLLISYYMKDIINAPENKNNGDV